MNTVLKSIIGLVALFFTITATALPITACFSEGTCLKFDDTLVSSTIAFKRYGDPVKLSGPDSLISYTINESSTMNFYDDLQIKIGSSSLSGDYDYLTFATNEISLDYTLGMFDLLTDAIGVNFYKFYDNNIIPRYDIERHTLNSVSYGTPSSVPEPGALALMSLGLLGLGLSRRKKIKNTKAL